MDNTTSPIPPPPAPTTQVYAVAVVLALFSLVIILLVLPPLFWHFRNRNIGATSLIAWVIAMLFFTFVNALIWPSDNLDTWFSGVGLCDIEVRIQAASQVALPASFAAILRGLAAVLDTDHATLVQTKAQRRRNSTLDLLFCVGAPVLQLVFYEIVHYRRYAVAGVAGCTPVVHGSWFGMLLLAIPTLLWNVVNAVYAVLILARLYRYRLTFNSILATSNTTKSRFLRLYLICVLWTLIFLPIMIWLFVQNTYLAQGPFNWSETHNYDAYNGIFLIPSGGVVLWDRWIWLGTGVAVFAFFGFGREAVNMYRTGMLSIGLGKVVPSLHRDPHRRPTISTISSISSKARMLFKRKGSSTTSEATWNSKSSTLASRSYSQSDEPVSPKNATFLAAIQEAPPGDRDIEKGKQTTPARPSSVSRLASVWPNTGLFAPRTRGSVPVPLAELAGHGATVRSTVTTGERPVSLVRHMRDTSSDVLVRKEVRQGSEHE